MKIKVNQDCCVGHARCNAVAPDLFLLKDDGYSDIDVLEVPPGMEDLALKALRACPEGIISLVEEGPG